MTRIIADTQRITQHWDKDHPGNPIPYLMVRMSDGKIIRYNPEIEQPGFVKAMDNIKNMAVGYPAENKEAE